MAGLTSGSGAASGSASRGLLALERVEPAPVVGQSLANLDLAFGEGRSGLVIGDGGWLYSDEEFDPVPDAQRQMRDNLALIRGVRDALARRDIALVLAIVPAKARLYPEYLGEHRVDGLRADLYQRFHAAMRRADISAPDLLGPLQQAKSQGQLFLRTDTHWTPLGAEIAARQLSTAALPGGEKQQFVTETGTATLHKGDLTRFLPVDPLFSELLPPPDLLQQRQTHAADAAASAAEALFAERELPVALVGTSYSANPAWNFAGALRQYLQRDLSNQAVDGQGPIRPMLSYLRSDELSKAPPRLVIWEFPERYLPMASDLDDFDPAWIAELKAAPDRSAWRATADAETRQPPAPWPPL